MQNVDASDSDIKRQYNGFELGFNARLPRGARIFGGFNLEQTLADTCSAGTDPNFTLYCNQWDSGIPWAKQFKLAGTYPLPWWGITTSISLQSLMGYVVGTRAIPYGVFTFGTGFDVPNGQGTYWNVLPTTRYAANCTGAVPARRAGDPEHEPDLAERAAARSGDRVHAALQPARPVVQQDVQRPRLPHPAEGRHLQRDEQRPLVDGDHGAVRCGAPTCSPRRSCRAG